MAKVVPSLFPFFYYRQCGDEGENYLQRKSWSKAVVEIQSSTDENASRNSTNGVEPVWVHCHFDLATQGHLYVDG